MTAVQEIDYAVATKRSEIQKLRTAAAKKYLSIVNSEIYQHIQHEINHGRNFFDVESYMLLLEAKDRLQSEIKNYDQALEELDNENSNPL